MQTYQPRKIVNENVFINNNGTTSIKEILIGVSLFRLFKHPNNDDATKTETPQNNDVIVGFIPNGLFIQAKIIDETLNLSDFENEQVYQIFNGI